MNWTEIKVSPDGTHFLQDGRRIFSKVFIDVLKFHSPGIAPVKDKSGSYHILTTGEPLYQKRYLRTFGFYCNRAAVIDVNGWFHIDEKGHDAYQARYDWVGNYQESFCTVRSADGSYHHIKLDGSKLYEANYVYAGDFKDGIACVKCFDGLFRHISQTGEFIHKFAYLDLGVYHKGFSTAKDDKGWVHINIDGQPVYSQRYLIVEPFYNGFAVVTNFDGSKAIIDEAGNQVLAI